jgi:hypothetical protein
MRQFKLYLILFIICSFVSVHRLSSQTLPKLPEPNSLGRTGQLSLLESIEINGEDFSGESQFTGDVSFPVSLATMGAIEVQLQYNSNIHKQLRGDNNVTPTGWVGLGWTMEVGSIVAEINNTPEVWDDKYFYQDKDGSSEIIQTTEGVFQLRNYKLWKISRKLDASGYILGWEIIKEDGTIMRFGNYNKDTNQFILSPDEPTYATRCYLGFHGWVANPKVSSYGSATYIPYQWNLSDVQEIGDRRTTITYQQEQKRLVLSNDSTTMHYTRESYIHKIKDNMGGELEFVLGDKTADEYYADYPTYTQNLFDTKYLERIKLKRNDQVFKEIDLSYSTQDVLNIAAKKRYLTGIQIKDAQNNGLPMARFEYSGFGGNPLGDNPGALRRITYPNGGKVEYTYKAQMLDNLNLKYQTTISRSERMIADLSFLAKTGICGKDFFAVLDETALLSEINQGPIYRPLRVYRKDATGWFLDTSFRSACYNWSDSTDICKVGSDYIFINTKEGDAILRRTETGWKADTTIPQKVESAGGIYDNALVIGQGSNYLVIKHNQRMEESTLLYDISVIRLLPNEIQIDTVGTDYAEVYLYDENHSSYLTYRLQVDCGKNYFIVTSYNNGGNGFLDSHFKWQSGQWIKLMDKVLVQESMYFNFNIDQYNPVTGQIPGINPFHVYPEISPFHAIGDNFVVGVFPDNVDYSKVVVYQHTGTTLDTIEILSSVYQARRGFTSGNYYGIIGLGSGTNNCFLRSWNGSSFSDIGLFAADGRFVSANVIRNRLVYPFYLDVPYVYGLYLRAEKISSGGVRNIITLDSLLIGNGPYPPILGVNYSGYNAFFTDNTLPYWDNAFTRIRSHTMIGETVYSVTVDSIGFNPPYSARFWQTGNNFITSVFVPWDPPPISAARDSFEISSYSMGYDANGNPLFEGNPWDYVVDTKTYINGMGDVAVTEYLFENGVYDESFTSTKYNKVTVIPPGNNGKTITYYYNDLGSGKAQEFIYALHYKELDGVPYKIKLFNQDNPTTPFQTTINYYSAIGITDTLLGIFFRQLDSTQTIKDGVTKSVSYAYNNNLQLHKTTETNSDNSVKITKYTYAHEINDYSVMANDDVHMLSQIAQETLYETNTNNPVNARSSKVNTYKYWEEVGTYAPDKIYQWRENEGSVYLDNFTEWSSGTPDVEWLRISQVTDQDEYGNIIEYIDVYDRPTAIKWGYSKSIPIASIQNATNSETKIELCEEFYLTANGYLAQEFLLYNNGNGILTYTISDGAVSGYSQKVEIDNLTYNSAGLSINMGSLDSGIDYIVEFDYNVTEGKMELLSDTDGYGYRNEGWYYPSNCWQHERVLWDLGGNGNNCRLWFRAPWNGNGANNVTFYLDNVRVYPSDALCISQTYDPGFLMVTSQADASGINTHYEYDDFGRLDKSRNNNGELLVDHDYYYSRDGNGDVFASNDPNYIKTGKYYLNGYEDDFSNPAESSPHWQAVNGNWYYSNGQVIQYSNDAACFFLLKSPYDSYSDLEMSYKMKSTDDDIIGCVFRYSDPTNFYKFVMEKQRSFWGLYKTVEGVTTALVKNGNTYVPGQWYNVRIVCKGENIQVYVNDEKAFDVNDNTFSCGQVGLHCHCNLSSYYDDFQIEGNSSETITYYDGLGRDIQTQTRHGDEDIIAAIDYDALNREVKRWKPYIADTDHSYTDLYDADEQEPKSARYYYDGDPGPDCGDYPYSEIVYRNAFSEEVVNLGAPGATYQKNSGNTIDYSYGTNTISEFGYTANNLYKTTVNDENNHDTEMFSDKFGNKVGQISHGGIKTAFVYDISDNLTDIQPHNYFFPPHGVQENWLTSYQYNTLGQMIWKKTPDAGVVEYLYDKNGNLRFIDDALQNGLIIYYKYDDLNRVIEEGTCSHDYFYQDAADNPSQPPAGTVKVNYFYDDSATGCPQTQHNVRGRLSKVEYQDENSSDWSTIYYSYTDEGWIEWIVQDLPGNEVTSKTIEYEYDLQGNVTKINYNPGEEENMFFWYVYNEQGQLWIVFASTNNSKPSLASAIYEYWPTGQVKKLTLGEQSGGGYLEQLNYTYNERDWMKNIDGNDYGQILYYSDPPDGTPQYNGNISLISYFMNHLIGIHENNPGGSYAHRYAYSYDDLNQLTGAQFSYYHLSQSWQPEDHYSVPLISYDGMGNIQLLTRNNEAGSGIIYEYEYYAGSNKLKNLDGNTTTNYEYDANGNLTRDVSKIGAGTIYYDYRNQPYKVQDESNHTIKYGYDHTGTRIYKKYTTGSSLMHAHYYINDATGRTLAVYNKNGDMIFINLYGLDLIGKVQWVE